MALPPQLRGIDRARLPAGKEWDTLTRSLGGFMAQTADALSSRLTIGDNLAAEWLEVAITIPAPTVTYTNSWQADAAAANRPVGWRRDATGDVRLEGVIESGSVGSAAFTLPVGYRPEYAQQCLVPAYNGTSRLWGMLFLTQAGAVLPGVAEAIDTAANEEWHLDTVRFRTKELRPPFPMSIPSRLPAPPKGVWVANVVDLDGAEGRVQVSGAVRPDWDALYKAGAPVIRLRDVPGLEEGHRYKVTLLAILE